MPRIIGILTRHHSKRDTYGNVYYFAEYTDTRSGKTVKFTCDNVERIKYALQCMVNNPNKDEIEVFFQEQQHGQRELFRMMKGLPHAGNSGQDGAKFIIKALEE